MVITAQRNTFDVYVSRDPRLLFEASCLFLLSLIGAARHRKRRQRIHALCCSMNREFILESSPWELLGKAHPGWSRPANCHRHRRRSQVRHLYTGRDLEKNATVVELARRHSGR